MKFIEKYYKGIIIFLSLGALVAVSGVVQVVIENNIDKQQEEDNNQDELKEEIEENENDVESEIIEEEQDNNQEQEDIKEEQEDNNTTSDRPSNNVTKPNTNNNTQNNNTTTSNDTTKPNTSNDIQNNNQTNDTGNNQNDNEPNSGDLSDEKYDIINATMIDLTEEEDYTCFYNYYTHETWCYNKYDYVPRDAKSICGEGYKLSGKKVLFQDIDLCVLDTEETVIPATKVGYNKYECPTGYKPTQSMEGGSYDICTLADIYPINIEYGTCPTGYEPFLNITDPMEQISDEYSKDYKLQRCYKIYESYHLYTCPEGYNLNEGLCYKKLN